MPNSPFVAMMQENLQGHVSCLPRRLSSMRVEDGPDLLVVDSGLHSDTFNKILRPRCSEARLEEAIRSFGGRPFTIWLGPDDGVEEWAPLLAARGLFPVESETGMIAEAAVLPSQGPGVESLEIRRVLDRQGIEDFAAINAANWDPPDSAVALYFLAGLRILEDPECPMRLYAGYLNGEPAAAAELFLSGGGTVGGLHMISTRACFQRRGIGLAMTWHAAQEARRAGARHIVLQASAQGEPVYRRLGFTPLGMLTEFQRRA